MIILDIDMPTKCMNCPLLGRDNMYCQVYPRKDLNIIEVINDKPEWCPIKSSIEDIIDCTPEMIAKAMAEKETIESTKEDMCDNYCKYPNMDDCDMDSVCENCPLNNI